MNTRNKFFGRFTLLQFILTLALVAFIGAMLLAPPSARAETGTQSAGITNIIPNGSNAVAGTTFKIDDQLEVGAQITAVGSLNENGSTYYTVRRSVDGVT